jgi:hypothetical protein
MRWLGDHPRRSRLGGNHPYASALSFKASGGLILKDMGKGTPDVILHDEADVLPTVYGSGGAASGSGYFQAAQAKLIDRLSACLGFILSIYGDLGRQTAELIADVPGAPAALERSSGLMEVITGGIMQALAICRSLPGEPT